MGGVWERLVRSVKVTLENLRMPAKITNTELLVFISDAVDIINSRPLTCVPIDPQSLFENGHVLRRTHQLKPGAIEEKV